MSSELKYKIADKVVFQKVKTALGKNKSFIGLILKLLDCNKKLAGIKVRNTILVLKYTFLVQNRLKLRFLDVSVKSSCINQLCINQLCINWGFPKNYPSNPPNFLSN